MNELVFNFLFLTRLCVDNWVVVPTNSVLTITKQTVLIHPIIDEFYNHDPAFKRSSGFAHAKGQTIVGPHIGPLTTATSGTVPPVDNFVTSN